MGKVYRYKSILGYFYLTETNTPGIYEGVHKGNANTNPPYKETQLGTHPLAFFIKQYGLRAERLELVGEHETEPSGEKCWAIMYGYELLYIGESEEDCNNVLRDIVTLNRWASTGGKNTFSVHLTHKVPGEGVSDVDELPWDCHWQQGLMGWNLQPLVRKGVEITEGVKYSNREEKRAVVCAPSARLAMEKAKLLCTAPKLLSEVESLREAKHAKPTEAD